MKPSTTSYDGYGFLEALSQSSSNLLDELCNNAAKPSVATNPTKPISHTTNPFVRPASPKPTSHQPPPKRARSVTESNVKSFAGQQNFYKPPAQPVPLQPNEVEKPSSPILSTECKVKREGENLLITWTWIIDEANCDGSCFRTQKEIFDEIDRTLPTLINSIGPKAVSQPMSDEILAVLVELLALIKGRKYHKIDRY